MSSSGLVGPSGAGVHAAPASRFLSAARGTGAATVVLKAQRVTPSGFAPYGQLITPAEDGKAFDADDAQLMLDRGTPRLYIMRLRGREPVFDRMAFHTQVTQCLGVLQDHPWYMVVAQPSGGLEDYPRAQDMAAFEVPSGCYLKMNCGTWHAGPFFEGVDHLDFYNLELSDTDITDFSCHSYQAEGVTFQVTPPSV